MPTERIDAAQWRTDPRNPANRMGAGDNKFNSRSTYVDGRRFPSQLEADRYSLNLLRVKSGELSYFLMQVPFHLPGKIVYRCDFMEVYPDGRVEFVDTKGMQTKEFKLKKKLVESTYPIKIKIVTREDM